MTATTAAGSGDPSSGAPQPAPSAEVRQGLLLLVATAVLLIAAYSIWRQLQPPMWKDEAFLSSVESNTAEPADLLDLPLVDAAGAPVQLRKQLGGRNLVIVITRGYLSGSAGGDSTPRMPNQPGICIYCATQTSELAANMAAFAQHNAAVLAVVPVRSREEAAGLNEFYAAAQEKGATDPLPFPVVLDVELKAVDKLGIRSQLAHPSAYIIDKDGKVRLAYVGRSAADRPSAAALLERLGQINSPR